VTELAKTVEQLAACLLCSDTKLAAAVGRVDALEICIGTSGNSQSNMIRDVDSQHDSIPWTGQHKDSLQDHVAGHTASTATNSVKQGGNEISEVTLEAREKRLEEAVARLDKLFEGFKQSQSNLMEDNVAAADATLSTNLDGIRALLSQCKGPAENVRLDFQHPTPVTSEPVCQGSAWHALSQQAQQHQATAASTSAVLTRSLDDLLSHGKPMQVPNKPSSARWAFGRFPSSVQVPSSRATIGVPSASAEHRDRVRTRPQLLHVLPAE